MCFLVVSEKSVHSVPEHAEKNMINLYFGQFLIFFCVSYLTLLVGRQEGHPACKKTERWGAGVVICLE